MTEGLSFQEEHTVQPIIEWKPVRLSIKFLIRQNYRFIYLSYRFSNKIHLLMAQKRQKGIFMTGFWFIIHIDVGIIKKYLIFLRIHLPLNSCRFCGNETIETKKKSDYLLDLIAANIKQVIE